MPATQADMPRTIYENVRLFESNSNVYHRYRITDLRCYDSLKQTFADEKINIAEYKTRIPENLSKVLSESEYLLKLKDNWDDEGAIAISHLAYSNAIAFLKSYAERIVDVWGDEKKCFLPPSIAPVKDGTVDIEWNLDNSYLLINFPDSTEEFVYYYLAFKEGDEISFDANGQINIKHVNDRFASQILDLS